MPRRHSLTLSALLMGALSACAFSIDPALVRPADDAGNDEHAEDAGSQESDAGSRDEDDPFDAGEPDAADAGPNHDGATTAPPLEGVPPSSLPSSDAAASSGCTNDINCAADRMCVATACVPRCSESAGCAVGTLPLSDNGFWDAINDGKETVYYLYYDGYTNTPRGNVLWKYRRGTPPVELGRDFSTLVNLLFVANDYVYYFSRMALLSSLDLYRVSVNGAAPELVEKEVLSAWRTQENVWWSKQVEGVCRLWKSPAEGALTPALLPAAGGDGRSNCGWSTGSETWLVRNVMPTVTEAIVLDYLPDLTRNVTVAQLDPLSVVVGADDKAIYAHTQDEYRRYWDDSSMMAALTAAPVRIAPRTAYELKVSRWGWVYWQAKDADGPSLGRTHRELGDYQRGELVRLPRSARIEGFTALPTALLYASDGRIYEKETPLPCNTGMRCPAWLSCQGTCR